ncbi:DUF697 domain-containing protein [Sphingobacteriales bacterium UPWRP_1]|nr:hypothetical protein B6N25_06095 [Sphingobacteriales bacterium TSM_CSS]PSJ78643.1 DUF697 domain-containing protein [Sphingobacteriales bacterium UPWRP_1]
MSADKQARKTKATDIITHNVLLSMGAAIIPVPVADIIALTTLQAKMLKELCDLYQKPFSNDIARNIITAVAGNSLARIGSSIIKAIPGLGTLIGGVSAVILSGASTYAIGQVFVKNLEEGKAMEEINLDAARELYKQELEKGKEVASQLEKESEVPPGSTSTGNDSTDFEENKRMNVIHLLKELSNLNQQGIITDEEFAAKKKELLEQI